MKHPFYTNKVQFIIIIAEVAIFARTKG